MNLKTIMGELTTTNSRAELTMFSRSPKKYAKAVSDKIRSIKDALTIETFTLDEVAKTDLQGLQAWLISSIGVMLEYYGFKADESVSLNQLRMLTTDICEKYSTYSMADLIMCFKLARQNPSVYGKFYGRFDASVVMGWLSIYSKERDEIIPTLPENNIPVYKPAESDMTRDEYIDCNLAMAAGGDEYAYKRYQLAVESERWRMKIAGQSAVYRYNMKHRYDK